MASDAELRQMELTRAWPRWHVTERLEDLTQYMLKADRYKNEREDWIVDLDLFRRGMAIEAVCYVFFDDILI